MRTPGWLAGYVHAPTLIYWTRPAMLTTRPLLPRLLWLHDHKIRIYSIVHIISRFIEMSFTYLRVRTCLLTHLSLIADFQPYSHILDARGHGLPP